MNGKQSSDKNLVKNVLNNFVRQFKDCDFPVRNSLQLKETLEVWHGAPQEKVLSYRSILCLIFAETAHGQEQGSTLLK